jgi:hypothetical protein
MEYADSDMIKELKLAAKWSVDNNAKKKAILQLIRYGDEARPALEEVLGITVYSDIKQACLNAIGALGKNKKDRATNNNEYKISTRTIAKAKKQIKKRKRVK